MTHDPDRPTEFVRSTVDVFYDRHRDQGFFSSSKGDGYRTLNVFDLREVASIAEEQATENAQRVEAVWIERVGQFLAALEDLAGQAQDEEHSTPEEAIGWAAEQFKQIFHVTEA